MKRLFHSIVAILLIPCLMMDPSATQQALARPAVWRAVMPSIDPVGAAPRGRPQSRSRSQSESHLIQSNQISGRHGGLPLQCPFVSQALAIHPGEGFPRPGSPSDAQRAKEASMALIGVTSTALLHAAPAGGLSEGAGKEGSVSLKLDVAPQLQKQRARPIWSDARRRMAAQTIIYLNVNRPLRENTIIEEFRRAYGVDNRPLYLLVKGKYVRPNQLLPSNAQRIYVTNVEPRLSAKYWPSPPAAPDATQPPIPSKQPAKKPGPAYMSFTSGDQLYKRSDPFVKGFDPAQRIEERLYGLVSQPGDDFAGGPGASKPAGPAELQKHVIDLIRRSRTLDSTVFKRFAHILQVELPRTGWVDRISDLIQFIRESKWNGKRVRRVGSELITSSMPQVPLAVRSPLLPGPGEQLDFSRLDSERTVAIARAFHELLQIVGLERRTAVVPIIGHKGILLGTIRLDLSRRQEEEKILLDLLPVADQSGFGESLPALRSYINPLDPFGVLAAVKVIHALGAYRSPIQAAERQSISTGVIVSPSIQFLDWVLFSVLGLPKGWQPYTLLKNIRLRPEIVILKLIHALQREPEQWVKARKFLEDYQQFRESPIIKTARSPLNDLAAYVADLLIPSVQEAERLITRQLGGAGSPRVIDVQVTLAARAA